MEFLLAVAQNNIEKARHFIQTGIDVNSPILWNAKDTYSPVLPSDAATCPEVRERLQASQEYYSRALNIAVLGGYADMTRLLLSAGADINLKDGRGRTALICAIYGLDLDVTDINPTNLPLISRTHDHHFDIMKNILLRHPNLSVSTVDSPQYEIKGITPLCLASYLSKAEIIRLLLDDGRVNVDGTDSKNATALMYAARDGNLPIVKLLLSYHASPDLVDNHGWSAIQYAGRNPEIVQLYEEALRCKRAESAHLHDMMPLAKYPPSYTKLSTLITSLPEYPSSLSHVQFDTLKDIDLLDPKAAPVVELIQSAFLQSIKTHDHSTLQTLLLWTPPLHPDQRPVSGPLLVNYHEPKTGMTALHHAMRTKPLPSLDTIGLLYQAGADINAQTYYGRTALHHLARFGADKDGKSWGIQKSNRNPAEAAASSSKKVTPPAATTTTNPDRVADPTDDKRSSIQSSSPSVLDMNDPTLKQILAAPTIPQHLAMCASLLIRLGALVNIADPTGNTPLHFAAEFGGVPEVLEVLILEGNADLSLKNKKGLTPMDVARSEEIRKRLLALENERKQSQKTKSYTTTGGSVRPLETASDCRSHTLSRSVSRSTLQSIQEPRPRGKLRSNIPRQTADEEEEDASQQSSEALDDIDADFEKVLKSFLSYQTTFTDSIESALASITESILKGPKSVAEQEPVANTIAQLQFELREAHEMFNGTEQRTDRVMSHYRQELEQVEQIHQADWDLSELQCDKVEKLFDVFERIENRFGQLELDQDELIGQVEAVRKVAIRRLDKWTTTTTTVQCSTEDNELSDALCNLYQTLLILGAVDPVMYSGQDIQRLCNDIGDLVHRTLEIAAAGQQFAQIRENIKTKWTVVENMLNQAMDMDHKVKPSSPAAAVPLTEYIQMPTYWEKQMTAARLYSKDTKQVTLNELELTFEIQQSNLYEIQKDLEETSKQLAALTTEKRKMYEACLRLENELQQQLPINGTRTEDVVRDELNKVLLNTRSLFDTQAVLESERAQLIKELRHAEGLLEDTRAKLLKVRPPVLLQGLVERLETDGFPIVRIEKDWKEDPELVVEIFDSAAEDDNTSSTSCYSDNDVSVSPSVPQWLDRCKNKLTVQCVVARLDASLYCLKVLAKNRISRSRQALLEVQGMLTRAQTELDDARAQMQALYDDAAEVAHQVFVLKTELETIVKHRKEEIVKVWEVVAEVSEGVDAQLIAAAKPSKKEPPKETRVEDNDRHQWIVRELEQLQNVHDNLQEAIEELQREQEEIGQNIRRLASTLIDPQVERLVGQDNTSLLSVSDSLAVLMDRIRHREFGFLSADDQPPTTSVRTEQPSAASRVVNRRLSTATQNSVRSTVSRPVRTRARVTSTTRGDKKRLSVMSTSSFTSLSSYQQDRMLARASTLSSAYNRTQKAQ